MKNKIKLTTLLPILLFLFLFLFPANSQALPSWSTPATSPERMGFGWPQWCSSSNNGASCPDVSATWLICPNGEEVFTTPMGSARVNGCMLCAQESFCQVSQNFYTYFLYNGTCVANNLPNTGFCNYNNYNGPIAWGNTDKWGTEFWWCDPNPSTCGSASSNNPNFTLSATPASRSVNQGQSAQYTITATVTNDSGTFNFVASNCPTNATCTYNPSSISLNNNSGSTVLTVQTAAGTPVNNYSITTSLVSSGFPFASATHQLTVNAGASCNPGTIGTNQFVGCAYSGTSFNTLTGGQLTGLPTLTSPAPLSAAPLPNTDWGSGGPNGLTNNFSARWKGNFTFQNGNYTFTTRSDDGSRAYVDNNSNGVYNSGTDTLLVNHWSDHGLEPSMTGASIALNGTKTIIYEMYEASGGAGYGLSWSGTAIVSGLTATCDGSYREVPGNGATPSQPAAVYLQPDKTSSAAPDSIAVSLRGTNNRIYYQYCRFNGTNTCTWGGNWLEVPGNGLTSWSPYGQTGGAWDLFHRSSTGNQMHIINWADNWKGDGDIVNTWVSQGADGGWAGWGMSFNPYTSARGLKTQDKLSRWWEFQKGTGADNKIYYACNSGTPPASSCVNLPFGSASVSPGTVNANGSFNVTCDYQVRGLDSSTLTVTSSPVGVSCGNPSWSSSGTAASFACTAPSAGGPYTISCRVNNNAAYNACSQTNQIPGTLTVNAPAATASISAATNNIPYNTGTTINWSSTNATSCSVSPSGWSGTSGSQSTGNLTASRTYTATCQPSGANSSASITVNVQAQPTAGLTVIKSGQGTVTSNPAGINCGSDCAENYPTNTSVTLTATPATGRIFTGWSVSGGGSCPGRGTCSVVMTNPKTVTANFAVDPNYQEF